MADASQLFQSGAYAESAKMGEKALKDYGNKEAWQLLLTRSLLAQGKYREALNVITNTLARNSWSVQLRWQAREVFLRNGATRQAAEMLDNVIDTVSAQPRAYREAPDLLVFGQAALLKGADPKRVLDSIFDMARKADPKLRDVYLASGQLALDKHDYALAARKFEEGLKQLPKDPDLHFGVAQAYAPSDAALAKSALESTLDGNSNHVGALLLLVDRSIDSEDYAQANKLLDQVQAVNPAEPDAWAYRAVLAHFRNHPDEEKSARESGLKFWKSNPRVDHLIGQKLSQHYRFSEGAGFQRQALRFDPEYLPAKAQLAQDLLRLGQEAEGWQLAGEVSKQDEYDVEAYNLSTLHDTLAKFTTLTNRDFEVRMSSREAVLYGDRVLNLLSKARETLAAKYGMELRRPTLVEIFPEQKDFAVRTFGMPGNPGYLGVCFGTVITANSPASQAAHPVNWEAVLWHEFTHVVSLQMTRNRMPRWLSEGISVYEELQANPAWGQRMEPRYREIILSGGLTPVSKLSGAFMSSDTELDLQFAYYESSLVVDYIVRQYGLDKLKALLSALGEGMEINQAIAERVAPMKQIEEGFAKFARARAKSLAPGLDWEKPGGGDSLAIEEKQQPDKPSPRKRVKVGDAVRQLIGGNGWEEWAKAHPTNFWVLTSRAEELMQQKNWAEAKTVLNQLIEYYPDFTGSDSPYRPLASAHRALGETNQELRVLTRFATLDDAAPDAYRRLMFLGSGQKDWETVHQNASRFLAVNPLVPEPYQYLAQAAEAQNQLAEAISARRALLQLEPADPAQAHYDLARLLYRAGDPRARNEVVLALEEAPRYRAALDLLWDLSRDPKFSADAANSKAQP